MLILIEAGQDGKRHIQEKLAVSIESSFHLPIATACFEAKLLSSAHSFVVVEVTHTSDLNNFEAWCGNGGEEAKQLLSKWIWEFVNINPAHVCLIDETRSKASDIGWQDDMAKVFADTVRFSKGSIFYCVSSITISNEKLPELIESTFWFPFYCAFVIDTDRILETSLPEQEISEEHLSKLSQQTQGFVTDAYDLEGLLLLNRQQDFSLDKPF